MVDEAKVSALFKDYERPLFGPNGVYAEIDKMRREIEHQRRREVRALIEDVSRPLSENDAIREIHRRLLSIAVFWLKGQAS